MSRAEQRARAERFRALHHDPKLLVLPNIWDPLGALMIQSLGFPAVATASAAVANVHAFEDGEHIPFDTVLEVIERIAAAVEVPLTADIEGGYADAPSDVAANMERVIDAGAVGINLEDSRDDGKVMRSADEQCARIAAVRTMADAKQIPLVINARTDVFLAGGEASREARTTEVIERGRAYLEAGADCIYPVGPADAATARTLWEGLRAPINLYLSKKAAPLAELEAIGIARASVGPGLMRASLAEMRRAANDLLEGRSYQRFTTDAVTAAEVQMYLTGEGRTEPA